MSAWWTYRPEDLLLFSPETYRRLFELYNEALWPAQLPVLALGAVVPLFLLRPRGERAVSALLAAGWLWTGWGFHWERYAEINWAASAFAAVFALQAALLGWQGLVRGRILFGGAPAPPAYAGLAVYLLALAGYPLAAPLAGDSWRAAQVLGLAPDPTVVATLGLLLTARRAHWGLLVVPLLWCAVTGVTLWTMGAPAAWPAPAAGLLTAVLSLWKHPGLTAAVRASKPPGAG